MHVSRYLFQILNGIHMIRINHLVKFYVNSIGLFTLRSFLPIPVDALEDW